MTPVRTANVDMSRLVWLGATCAMALCVITLSLVSCKSSPVATTPGTTTPENEPTIRVRIARDIHEVRVASAASPTASLLIRAQGQASRRVTGPVRVRITGSGPAAAIEITENRPVGQVLLRSNLPISIASDGEDGFNLDDRLFPGSARILAGKDTLSVIALVPTETYVAGVIAVAFPLALLLGGKALDLWPLFGATNQILAGLSLTVNDGGSGFAAGWRRRIAARRTSGWVVTALSGGAPLRRLGFRRIRSPGETNFSTPPRSSISRATDSSTRARS